MTTWVYKNIFLAGEMTTWSILHLTSQRRKYSSPKDRRKKRKEGGIRERHERHFAFKEALDRLAPLSEPQAGG